jgi:hypothetical protein
MKPQVRRLKKLNQDDIFIICCATNDLVINKSTLAFQNTSNIVTKSNHTNIINIPYRHNTANTNTVNKGIEKFNMKLEKLIKAPTHASFLKTEQNRKLFMKHGLYHNRLGKQILFHQIASMVYSALEHKTTCSISLGWNKPDDSVSQGKSLNRVTTPKNFEKIIYKRLYQHLTSNNMLVREQFCFWCNYSTEI